MVEIAQSIDMELSKKLRDPNYRKKFFLAEASARIAAQLIALRKRRGLNQKELAEKIGTKQPAISRVERADYNNWSFSTLRAIAEQLDARISVTIQPSEDVIYEYETTDQEPDRVVKPSLGLSGASWGKTIMLVPPVRFQSGVVPTKPLGTSIIPGDT